MRVQTSIGGMMLVALVAACGGSSPTQAPGAATQNPAATTVGGGATPDPGATQSGGVGGGIIDSSHGKIHLEIHGPIEKTADLGLVPAASLFGGTGQVTTLSYTNEATSEVATVAVTADGKLIVSYGTGTEAVPAAECTTSNLNTGPTSASGSFDCTAVIAITSSGAQVQGVTVKGNFDAHS